MASRNNSRAAGDNSYRSMDMGSHMRKVATDLILPRMHFKGTEAVGVDTHRFYYYQKRTTGRRCSCYGVETSAQSACVVCLGRGVVAVYDKFGTETYVLDCTHQDISTVNVHTDYDGQDAPVRFKLNKHYDATRGEINFTLKFNKSVIGVDVLQSIYTYQAGESTVTVLVKSADDVDFVPLTKESLLARLSYGTLQVKVVLRRATPESHVPTFSHVYLRLNTMTTEKSLIKGDVPKTTKTNVLQEYGLQQNLDTRSLWIPHQRVLPKTDDLFYDLEDQTLWKVISTTDLKPLQMNMAWDIQLSFVQPNQPENKLLK